MKQITNDTSEKNVSIIQKKPLAEKTEFRLSSGTKVNGSITTLLGTDQKRSVLRVSDTALPHSTHYTPYGYRSPGSNTLLSLLGFNGEYAENVTGHYLLGNGYRAFNPTLMRFNSPDNFSPFGKGGLNAYSYVEGDPINYSDPTGESSFFGAIGRAFRVVKRVTTSSSAAKDVPRAFKLRPMTYGVAREKTLHKITTFDIEKVGRVRSHILHGTVSVEASSVWREMGEVSNYATNNYGRLGITSTSRKRMDALIQEGAVNVRQQLHRANQIRRQQAPTDRKIIKHYLGAND